MATKREKLTAGRVTKYECEPGKGQSFLWDSHAPGLAVRATKAGNKAYIFQGRLKAGDVVRITIGDCRTWVLDEARDASGEIILPGARQEAARLQAIIDQGGDPRQVRADKAASLQAQKLAAAENLRAVMDAERRSVVTLGEAWRTYINTRRSKWSERHLIDHEKVIKEEQTKGEGEHLRTLKAGVLASLAPLPLSAINAEKVTEWLDLETPRRGTQAALAFRLLRAFLNWCEEQAEYRSIAAPNACARKVSRDHVKKPRAKNDVLQREQLAIWFEAVRGIANRTISTYLQGLLITGARRNELASLRWECVDFRWNSLTIDDKVEEKRTIPLTPYFAELLRDLQRSNKTPASKRRQKTLEARGEKWAPSPWVFSSQTSATGHIEEPSIQHRQACAKVGLAGLTLHGLRRSFGSLSEWCECPVGTVAQIQGHKPSAIAEKHYRVRSIDLLRGWHTKIEAWILNEAGLVQPQATSAPPLEAEKTST